MRTCHVGVIFPLEVGEGPWVEPEGGNVDWPRGDRGEVGNHGCDGRNLGLNVGKPWTRPGENHGLDVWESEAGHQMWGHGMNMGLSHS